MHGFTWTEAMSVGVAALDADHRCLVRIISLLDDVVPEDAERVVGIVMETLVAYCRYHFAREEQVLAACDFPEIAFHQSEHEEFCQVVECLRQRRGRSDAASMAAEMGEYLRGWLLHHILIQDMAYKPFVTPMAGIEGVLSAVPFGDAAQHCEMQTA